MPPSSRPLSSSPWTVVLQGSNLSYEDATQLDKLEYAIGIGGPSVDRYLAQKDVILHLSTALSEAAKNITQSDSHVRAGKLLASVVKYSIANNRAHALSQFLHGLDTCLFENFINAIGNEKEAASWYLGAIGPVLGLRRLADFAKPIDIAPVLDIQKSKFVSACVNILSVITNDSLRANHDEDDQDNIPSTSAALPPSPPASKRSNILQSSVSSLGYIPTVADIGASVPPGYATAGDDQLGRILSGIARFLATDANRYLFCTAATSSTRPAAILAALLDKEVGMPVQVYYQAVFCLWLLSFVSQKDSDSNAVMAVSSALEEASVSRRLTNVLREVWAEKVVRISLATLRNMLKMSTILRKEMVGAGLVSALQSLCFRRWNDEDIRDDLGVLAEALESELASMSNFDVYRAEILSGALEWTPAHRDETFWEQNAEKLERNQQEVLRCLVRLLNESSDGTVLAVACNDLAQFIKHYANGRLIAQSLGVKTRLMELMVSGEGDVRRYALNCVQVLMIRWNRQEA